jgi:hypothetical protein
MVVVPINEEIEIFQKSLVTFENEQNFDTLKSLIRLGIKNGSDLRQITTRMDRILVCDEHTFWSTEVAKDNWLMQILQGFWDIFVDIEILIDVDDKFIKNLEKQSTTLPKEKQDEKVKNLPLQNHTDTALEKAQKNIDEELHNLGLPSIQNKELAQSLADFTQANLELSDHYSSLIKVSTQNNCRFFPQPYFLMGAESEKEVSSHLEKANELSQHFEKYFSPKGYYRENDALNVAFYNSTKVSPENLKEIMKIFAAVLCSRHANAYSVSSDANSVEEFLKLRIASSSMSEVTKQGKQEAELTIISINLIMASQLFEVDGTKFGLFSGQENINDSLVHYSRTHNTIDRILTLLPQSAANLIIMLWGHGSYALSSDFLSEISISEKGYFDGPSLQISIEDLFRADTENTDFFEYFFVEFAYKNTRTWHFDMELIHDLDACTFFNLIDFDEYPNFERALSNALERSDKKKSRTGHQMPLELIDDYNFSRSVCQAQYDVRSHPALHILPFCSDPYTSDPNRWIKLAEAFLNFGNAYYASTVITLFIECRLRLEIIESEDIEKIDLVSLNKILTRLLGFPSFKLVQESIRHYLSASEHANDIVGCIAAFVEGNKPKTDSLKVISFNKNWRAAYFSPIDFDFSPLNNQAADHFEKALQLIESKKLFEAGFSNHAFTDIAKGLEAEFKHRLKSLGEADIKYLEAKTGLRLPRGNDTYDLTLGSLLKIIRDARHLPKHIQNKIPQIMTIIQSKDYDKFMATSYTLLDSRNRNSHSLNPNKHKDLPKIQSELLSAKKELLEDGFLETLCETAY